MSQDKAQVNLTLNGMTLSSILHEDNCLSDSMSPDV